MKWCNVLETYIIAFLGGVLFYYCQFPLPWILGPITFIILWNTLLARPLYCPKTLRDGGFVILGIFFGLFFTTTTLEIVFPYVLPYLLITVIIVAISMVNSGLLSKVIPIDSITSVIGSIPGGLSQMVAASEDLDANVAMVTILQTVRLLTVVFFVPFTVVHFFNEGASSFIHPGSENNGEGWSYLWFSLSFFVGWLMRKRLPAAFVIGPLLATAGMNISGVDLPSLPTIIVIWGQITVGMYMGTSISIKDLKLGGKYCFYYSGLAIILVLVSFGFGYLLSIVTDLSLPTAMLSVAPGGLIEMALTASAVGADPMVVSSLQLIRLLFIVLVVPTVLKLLLRRRGVEMKS